MIALQNQDKNVFGGEGEWVMKRNSYFTNAPHNKARLRVLCRSNDCLAVYCEICLFGFVVFHCNGVE